MTNSKARSAIRIPLYIVVIAMGVVLMMDGMWLGFVQVVLGALVLGLHIRRIAAPEKKPDPAS